MKDELRFIMTVNGEQCVMMSSLVQMERLFADSLDTRHCKCKVKREN